MSAYPPPNSNNAIFNPVDFIFNNFPLTINDAKNYFVEYPTAQGTETLLTTIVNGSSTFNDTATFNDLVEVKQPNPALNGLNVENDTPGQSFTATSTTLPGSAGLLTQQGSATLAETNPIVQAGDSVISSSIFGADDTGSLTLTQKSTTTGSGIRLANNKVNVFPGIMFPDGTEQITAAGGAGVHTFCESYEYTGASGSFINIPIPSGAIMCDVLVYAMGGIAGVAYVGGSYYVMGGSGGGGGMCSCYGVPAENIQMDFYWTSGAGNEAHIQITQDPATAPPPLSGTTFNLGTANNGSNGGNGTSAGTGPAGIGGTFTTNSNFISGGNNGTNGQLGTSNAIPFGAPPPNSAAPTDVGRIKSQFRWVQEGLLGVGQKWLANGSLGTSNTAYGGLPTAVITWYLP